MAYRWTALALAVLVAAGCGADDTTMDDPKAEPFGSSSSALQREVGARVIADDHGAERSEQFPPSEWKDISPAQYAQEVGKLVEPNFDPASVAGLEDLEDTVRDPRIVDGLVPIVIDVVDAEFHVPHLQGLGREERERTTGVQTDWVEARRAPIRAKLDTLGCAGRDGELAQRSGLRRGAERRDHHDRVLAGGRVDLFRQRARRLVGAIRRPVDGDGHADQQVP